MNAVARLIVLVNIIFVIAVWRAKEPESIVPTMIRWSQEKRRKMYSEIVKEIGPHRAWDEKIRPLQRRQEYNQLLARLAAEFGGEPSALQQQINFATTTQWGLINQSHIKSFILNKAAALETGFILTNELPNRLTAD